MSKTVTAEILQKCLDIHKDRDKQYGGSAQSFKQIAKLATMLSNEDFTFTAKDVAVLMVATKLCRYNYALQHHGMPNREAVIKDSLRDSIVYTAIIENIRLNELNKDVKDDTKDS